MVYTFCYLSLVLDPWTRLRSNLYQLYDPNQLNKHKCRNFVHKTRKNLLYKRRPKVSSVIQKFDNMFKNFVFVGLVDRKFTLFQSAEARLILEARSIKFFNCPRIVINNYELLKKQPMNSFYLKINKILNTETLK